MTASGTSPVPASRPSFWRWLATGSGAKPGWLRFLDRWLLLHVAVGVAVSFVVPVPLREAANTVLLPLVGILIGLTFAWAGNAQALLQSTEIERLSQHHPGGFEEYVYTYQLAILTVLATLVAWGLAGLGVLDRPCPWSCPPALYRLTEALLYGLASLTLRECWHVVMGAQRMLLLQSDVRRALAKRQGGGAP